MEGKKSTGHGSLSKDNKTELPLFSLYLSEVKFWCEPDSQKGGIIALLEMGTDSALPAARNPFHLMTDFPLSEKKTRSPPPKVTVRERKTPLTSILPPLSLSQNKYLPEIRIPLISFYGDLEISFNLVVFSALLAMAFGIEINV